MLYVTIVCLVSSMHCMLYVTTVCLVSSMHCTLYVTTVCLVSSMHIHCMLLCVCYLLLHRHQPCEPIREQNFEMWLDGIVVV